MDEAENQINHAENKEAKKKNKPSEQQEKKRIWRNEDSISSLWENFKQSNIHIIACQKKRKGRKLKICLKKIIKENFPNLVNKMDIQAQEAQSSKQDGPKEAHSTTHHN